MKNILIMNNYWFEYEQKPAKHKIDICLATKNPNEYCNGYYRYSDKDPGSGKEFVIIDTNDPICKEILPTNHIKEILQDFFNFAEPIYWGENEFSSYPEIIDLYIKKIQQKSNDPL